MHKAWVLAAAMLNAGCLGFGTTDGDEGDDDAGQRGLDAGRGGGTPTPPETRTVTQTYTWDADVAQNVYTGRIGVEWIMPTRALTSGAFAFAWDAPTDRFGLEIEGPDGDVHVEPAPPDPRVTGIEGDLPSLESGEHTFYPTATGLVTPAHLTLEVTVTYEEIVLPDEVGTGSGNTTAPPASGVTVERTPDGYVARTTVRSDSDAAPVLRTTVSVANGDIDVHADATRTQAALTAWARGDSEKEARDRLAEMDLVVESSPGLLRAEADAPDWHDRGVDADVGIPAATVLTGSLGTSNGGITLLDTQVRELEASTSNGDIILRSVAGSGLSASTSNGGIEGDLEAAATHTWSTSNGGIVLAVTPTGPLRFTASTSNDDVALTLAEDTTIAYTISASTSNGQITEDMDDASLDGSGTHRTLRTGGGTARPLQVDGTASTSNSDVSFVGA